MGGPLVWRVRSAMVPTSVQAREFSRASARGARAGPLTKPARRGAGAQRSANRLLRRWGGSISRGSPRRARSAAGDLRLPPHLLLALDPRQDPLAQAQVLRRHLEQL